MAVPEQTPYIEYTANGVATSFALGFDCESKDHLIVTLDGVEPPVGSWSLTGGAVVFTTAPASGVLVVAHRNTPFSRTTDYQSYNNSFRPPVVNKDFDWIWFKLQELGVADWILGNRINALRTYVDRKDDELKNYLMDEIRKQGVALDQLEDYYNYLMQRLAQIAVDKGWDASFVVDASGLNQQKINKGVESISDLLAIPDPKNGSRVYVKGYRAATNLALAKPYKGGSDFVFISENAGVNNGITIFNGWTRLGITDNVTPEMAGAYANDINSDADAFDIAIQYAHVNDLQVHALGATYYIDREVNVLTGKHYGKPGTIIKGAGKAKTFIRIAKDVDCFNLTNIDQLNFATNVRITDLSFTQIEEAMNTGIALKTNADLTNVILSEISFFGCKQAVKFPKQFYIARLTSLHAQGCTYGFELGSEGTTLFLDNLFVTGGGGQPDSFAYKVRASYTTIGSLACDYFEGRGYDFQYGQYSIGALGLEFLHGQGALANISFYKSYFRIENIDIVNADNLTASDLIVFAGDSSGSIGNIATVNTIASSPAQLFRSTNSIIDVGGVSGATTYAKSTYAEQANVYGVELQGLRYQRGDMRPFLGLGNSNLPDQLTSHTNPCKQSILFDIYGENFNSSGYTGEQDWQWLPAPNLGDWGIQRRPDLFGIAATVSLASGGVCMGRTATQHGTIPLIVYAKPSTPATGCIYIDKTTKKVEIFITDSWVLLN